MPTCREIARQISAAYNRPLRLRERLATGLHLALCRDCRRYAHDLDALRCAIYKGRATSTDKLSPQARETIRARIKKEHLD
ncbi:MAG: anti-sigma factor family protein [Acidiferrobacter sp.]